MQEVEYHVAAFVAERGIHGYFAEEVFDLRIFDGECAKSVPQVVERVEAFGAGLCRLVADAHKRPPEFEHMRHVVVDECVGKSKQMRCGYNWLTVRRIVYVFAEYETIAADDFLLVRVPDNQLLAGFVHGVVFVDVGGFACAATGVAKGYFAQASDFAHGVWRVVRIDDVDFVAGLVGCAQKSFGCQFGFYQSHIDGGYDVLCHNGVLVMFCRLCVMVVCLNL